MTTNKPRALVIAQLPPPIHGASLMNQFVVESDVLNNEFDINVIPFQLSNQIDDIGQFNIGKVARFIKILCVFLVHVILRRPKFIYLTLPPVGPAFYAGCVLIIIAKCLRIRRMLHIHGKGIKIASSRRTAFLLYKFAFSGAHVILLSPSLSEDIEDVADMEQLIFIPNGVPDYGADVTASNNDQDSVTPTILYLSNLVITKGPLVLLDALALLRLRGREFKAEFAGAPSVELGADDFMRRVDELSLNDRVSYLGRVTGKAKEGALGRADIFAFPTYYPNEAFPIVLLEAMSFGLPIVTTPEGAIPDIVTNNGNGFIVPQTNVEALANALDVLITDRDIRGRLAASSRNRFEAHFTLAHFEQKLARAWRAVAG